MHFYDKRMAVDPRSFSIRTDSCGAINSELTNNFIWFLICISSQMTWRSTPISRTCKHLAPWRSSARTRGRWMLRRRHSRLRLCLPRRGSDEPQRRDHKVGNQAPDQTYKFLCRLIISHSVHNCFDLVIDSRKK